jgi:hypothetical protein
LQGFVPCLLAHHWRGIIYRDASPLFFINEENLRNYEDFD